MDYNSASLVFSYLCVPWYICEITYSPIWVQVDMISAVVQKQEILIQESSASRYSLLFVLIVLYSNTFPKF
jgi:hypothetical protein